MKIFINVYTWKYLMIIMFTLRDDFRVYFKKGGLIS